MQEDFKPGRRQSVTIVDLHGHGRGRLVWENGPPFFIPDNGEPPFALHRVSAGGASVADGAWENVWITDTFEPLRAKVIECGEMHQPAYSDLFGVGWLVFEKQRQWARFESEDGEVLCRFEWITLSCGRPEHAAKMGRAVTRVPKIDNPDEMNWSTFRTVGGSVLYFRRGGPPPPNGHYYSVSPSTYARMSAKARKAYDAAKKAGRIV